MVVTRVEAVTKTKYKVYVDGQFAFILYKGELSRFHIAEDQELSQESYEKIRTEVILKRAKKLAACPDDVSIAAVPPSRAAILAAT